jgi:hypothetical protein
MLYINQLVKWRHMAMVQHMERLLSLIVAISFAHSVCMFELTALDIDWGRCILERGWWGLCNCSDCIEDFECLETFHEISILDTEVPKSTGSDLKRYLWPTRSSRMAVAACRTTQALHNLQHQGRGSGRT